mgnify:CR=1 FL=1
MGSQVRHVRVDMSDEEWAKVKAVAQIRNESMASFIAKMLARETKIWPPIPEKART